MAPGRCARMAAYTAVKGTGMFDNHCNHHLYGDHFMKHDRFVRFRRFGVIAAAVALIIWAGALCAWETTAVGSGNVAIADPAIPRPATQPCVVALFTKQDFGSTGDNKRMDAIPHPFTYQPPARCKGPWAKVVLEADFSVDPGHQYDRSASIWLKGVNLYFGTTEEPSPQARQHWQIQRDLTDYSQLLRSAGAGEAWINNWLDSQRASVIHVSARLLFYPADAHTRAPSVPDAVYALNGTDTTPAKLESGTDRLSRSLAFPANTARVYLDVFAQPQFHDEFYYMCLKDAFIRQTADFALKRGYKGAPKKPRACGGGSFREVEVSVDGQAAGLAPISPWVFTGGIDPFLWRPTPGAETLNFMPYRVDLTPFAGLLSDGGKHSVSVRVLDANNFFSVAGTLLVYRDMQVKHTGGKVVRNTLAGLSLQPHVSSTLGSDSNAAGVNGDVQTQARQHYVIEGYVDTSRGRVQTRVDNDIRFGNTQLFASGSDQQRRHVVRQTARVESSSRSTGTAASARRLQRVVNYALNVDTLRSPSAAGNRDRSVQLRQDFERHIQESEAGLPVYMANVRNMHAAADHIDFNTGHVSAFRHHGQSSTQTFTFNNSLGDCYHAQVTARDGKVTGVSRGLGCMQPQSMHWFVHPDGSPDSYGWRRAHGS